MTKDNATPRPWSTDITWQRIDNHKGIPILKNGNVIAKAILFDSATVPRAESIANARLIVKAVNCHDELVNNLKVAKQWLDNIYQNCGPEVWAQFIEPNLPKELCEKLEVSGRFTMEQALAKAGAL